MTAFIVLVAIVMTTAYIFTAIASWFERAGQQLDALIDAALNDQATDFGEPTREQVEQGFLDETTETVDAHLLPLSQSETARRIRQRITDNECRRFRAELDGWGRPA